MSIGISFLENFILFLNIIVLSYVLFKSTIDIKRLFVTCSMFGVLFIMFYINNKSYPVSIWNIPVFFCLYAYVIDDDFINNMKTFSFIYVLLSFIGIALMSLSHLLNQDYMNLYGMIVLFLCSLGIVFFLRKNNFQQFSNKVRLLLLVVCMIFSFYLMFIDNMRLSVEPYFFKVNLFFGLLLIVFISLTIRGYIKEHYEKTLEKRKRESLNELVTIQEEYIRSLIEKEQTFNKYKHDTKAMIIAIHSYIQSNNLDGLTSYVDKLEGQITDESYLTSNHFINAIVSYFINTYEDVDIDVEDCVIGTIQILGEDLSSLFYNLIKNAIEAKNIHNHISIKLKNVKTSLYISIENKVEEDFILQNIYQKKTSKEDKNNHGIGLYVINEIVNKYNGFINYSLEDDVLLNEIILFDVVK